MQLQRVERNLIAAVSILGKERQRVALSYSHLLSRFRLNEISQRLELKLLLKVNHDDATKEVVSPFGRRAKVIRCLVYGKEYQNLDCRRQSTKSRNSRRGLQ